MRPKSIPTGTMSTWVLLAVALLVHAVTAAGACPPALLAAVAQQLRSRQLALEGSRLPAWPPPALKQGVACTLEVYQLSVPLPGTSTVCTALQLHNNIVADLPAYTLQWQQADGALVPVQAAGATLVQDGEPGAQPAAAAAAMRPVRLASAPDGPGIAAQGGVAHVLLQLNFTGPNRKSSPDGAQLPPWPGARAALDAVFLNGLQCTRLPLAALAPSPSQASWRLDDCAAAEWPLTPHGSAFAAPAELNLSSIAARRGDASGSAASGANSSALWASIDAELSAQLGNASGDSSSASFQPDAAAAVAALQQLACVSALCCGLQVAPSSAGAGANNTNGSSSSSNMTTGGGAAGGVGAFEGQTGSGEAHPAANSTAGDVQAAPAAPGAQPAQPAQPASSGNAATNPALVAGVAAGSVAGVCLASVLVLLAVRRRLQQQLRDLSCKQAGSGVPAHAQPGHHQPGSSDRGRSTSHGCQQQQPLAHHAATHFTAATRPPPWVPGPRGLAHGEATLPTHHTHRTMPLARQASDAAARVLVTTGSGAAVWRASSWQGPDAHTQHARVLSRESQLLRSASSPSPLLPMPAGAAAQVHPKQQHPQQQHHPQQHHPQQQGGVAATWGSLRRLFSSSSDGSSRAPAPFSSTLDSAASSAAAHQQRSVLAGGGAVGSSSLQAAAAPHTHHVTVAGSGRDSPAVQGSGGSGAAGGAGRAQPPSLGRISPATSAPDDSSSVGSSCGGAPVGVTGISRQLLGEQPGWLDMDFAAEVQLERKLGEGGFGQVFRARWRGEAIAVKLVPIMSLVTQQHGAAESLRLLSAAVCADGGGARADAAAGAGQQLRGPLGGPSVGVQFSAASLRAVKVEVRVLSQLSHPNVVRFMGACLAPPHICILEELAEGGSLHNRLYSRSGARRTHWQTQQQQPTGAIGGSSRASLLPPPLSMREVLSIACDIASAMLYLHSLPVQVVHRDLKPQNVLLDLQGNAKLCDFGVARMKDMSLQASSTRLAAGTPAYMAPETFEGCAVTDKSDVYAFGVLLWEVCAQQQPWRELSAMQVICAVGVRAERLPRPPRCPDGMWALVTACWDHCPHARPSFDAVLHTLRRLQRQLVAVEDDVDAHVAVVW